MMMRVRDLSAWWMATFATLVLLPTLPARAAAPSPVAGVAVPARVEIPLAAGWRFRFGAQGDPAVPGYDDAGWSTVSVPHTWNRVGTYLPDPAMHLNRTADVNREQGVGWYRLTFDAPADAAGRRAWLQFDAASRVATVWLNGVRLGEHAGGFSRFRFDATAALRTDASNLLVVKTDNTQPAPGTATEATLPYAGDFFVHGGLYRPVSLLLTDPVHVDLLDAGGPGAYATTVAADASQATVSVRTRVRNDGGRAEQLVVVTELLGEGGVVARSEDRLAVPATGGADVTQSLAVVRPRLWQGLDDPFLHTLRVSLRDARGRVRDVLEQPYGIRTIAFDSRGLLLNGKPLRLRGVGYHQDREGKGWAVGRDDVAEDIAIIRDLGANSIRLTHYQHGQAVHDLADRNGLIVWDEIPLVTAWTLRDQSAPGAPLVANARQQLRELIRQNFNHASVAVWGLANEVDFGRSRPDFLGRPPAGALPDPRPFLQELQALAKVEDPSRATTLATCCELRLPDSAEVPTVADIADTVGANLYFGWYYGASAEVGDHLDRVHALRPAQPLAVSEYGAGGATTMHTDDPAAAPPDSRGRPQPEESMARIHEDNWRELAARPYLWATWLWNSFDFATTVRREGDADDINTKGLVTYDRRIRKDPFYFYRANWSAQPTVHVTSRRYVDRAYGVTDVRVYSNAPATELTVNGRSAGVQAGCAQRTCVWKAVALAPGDNRVVATGRFAGHAVEDIVSWRVDPAVAAAIRIDAGALMAATSVRGRFGSDAFFEGGEPSAADTPGGWGQAPVLAKIAGSPDRDLMTTFREGQFRYRVPLPDGPYRVTLSFVEPSAKPGERRFDVIENGRPALRDLDIAALAGAPLTAVTRQFTATATGGELVLEFTPTAGRAIVSAIEIER
jgi:beta-galactosidase